MYYIETQTPHYTITTSYATRKQAEMYGSISRSGELHLLAGEERHFLDSPELDEAGDCQDLGRVRTIFTSKADGTKTGRFMLYTLDCDEDGNTFYNFSGITFEEYKDANKFLKLKSMNTFNEMLIVENPEVSQAFDARGTFFSSDSDNPSHASMFSNVNPNIYDA